MKIDRINDDHIEEIVALEKLCFSDPWTLGMVKAEFVHPIAIRYGVFEGEKLIGYVFMRSIWDEAELLRIAVMPEYRKKGAASALLSNVLSWIPQKAIFLEVRESNAPAIALYEKFGFQRIALRPNYYNNPKEAAVIMRLEKM